MVLSPACGGLSKHDRRLDLQARVSITISPPEVTFIRRKRVRLRRTLPASVSPGIEKFCNPQSSDIQNQITNLRADACPLRNYSFRRSGDVPNA